MHNHVIQHIIKPKDCVMCFGIPMTKKELEKANMSPERDFSNNIFGNQFKYRDEVITPFEIVEKRLKSIGLKLVMDASIEEFRSIFQEVSNKVVILFSHYNDQKIEFKEGLIPFPKVSECIPKNFQGILDFCVCHPKEWILSLEETHPNLIKRYLEDDTEEDQSNNLIKGATPSIWLYFYQYLMYYLLEHETTYSEALIQSAIDFVKRFKKGG